MYWVCKICGRAMKAEKAPVFCYYDGLDQIENIGDEDAEQKMKLLPVAAYAYEFPGDVRYDPYSGREFSSVGGFTLSEYQDQVMEEVLG